ncbi:MAG: hypothetical protein ACK521_03020, partial [bacterium]
TIDRAQIKSAMAESRLTGLMDLISGNQVVQLKLNNFQKHINRTYGLHWTSRRRSQFAEAASHRGTLYC